MTPSTRALALLALGAETVAEHEDGSVTHYPADLDVSGLDAAITAAEAEHADLQLQARAATASNLKAAVDMEAERQRQRWITPGAGQAMTYARKAEEARALQGDADPQPAAYPMLAASLGIDGPDLGAVAATILAMDAQWQGIGAAIERRRLILKRTISEAADAAALAAIDITTGWPA